MKAVALVSGGLDSAVCLYLAKSLGYQCRSLSVSYGQRHSRELESAKLLCRRAKVPLTILNLKLDWLSASSLVGKTKPLPESSLSKIGKGKIPSTYVPGRNLLFCSLALSFADACGAGAVILGPNALDYSGYPDCRPEFYRALRLAAKLGTRAGAEGKEIKILTPLIKMSKAEIIKLGGRLKVPFGLTWSCYAGGRKPCGLCDSCKLRAKGFEEAGFPDPAL